MVAGGSPGRGTAGGAGDELGVSVVVLGGWHVGDATAGLGDVVVGGGGETRGFLAGSGDPVGDEDTSKLCKGGGGGGGGGDGDA